MAKAGLLFAGIVALFGLSCPQRILTIVTPHPDDLDLSSLPVGAWVVHAGVASEAARWLTQSTFVASSLETGRVGYLEAGNESEFAGAYSYALAGQPDGVSVDPDTGILTLDHPLPPGFHDFEAVVAGRGMSSRSARFPVRLDVREGVTENRIGNRILHKTYDVDGGTYGRPDGQDYTDVLSSVHRAVIADQRTAGEGNLRATIYFRRGRAYDYTVNDWLAGLQYVTVAADPRFNPDEPRPRLRNVRRTFTFDRELAILDSGGSTVFDLLPDRLKSFSPAIRDAAPGDDKVQLKDAADAKLLKVGRWHLIGSYDQQLDGFPPNVRYFDYVRILAVDGAEVSLDRKLRHRHRATYFEEPANARSLGVARILPLDLGGDGGLLPASDKRLTQRLTVKSIEFVRNPSTDNGSNVVLYVSGALDASFEDCILPRPVPTIVRHMRFMGGSIESSEPDKLISTLIFDAVQSGEIGGATGVDFFLIRDSRIAPLQVSPRHLRIVDSTIDGTTDTYFWYPVTFAYNGPVLSAAFESTTFRINPSNSDRRIMPAMRRPSVIIGDEAEWRGDVLVIPRSSTAFLDWQVSLFEGMIVYSDAHPDNWGVVRRLGSPGDGSAAWVTIDWKKGQRPLGGRLSAGRGVDLWIDDGSRLAGTARWNEASGGFMRQRLPHSFDAPPPAFPTDSWDNDALR